MLRIRRTLLLSALLCCCGVVSAGAQEMVQASQLQANHPMAQRARGIVELVLAGKRAEAESYLRAHGAPEWAAGAEMKTQLTAVMRQLANEGYSVDGIDRLGSDLIAIRIKDAAGEVVSAMFVRMDPADPVQIRQIRVTQLARFGTD